jgi:lipopolysaccharide/colanic/teichoic acid biosynthesis glycosyltransferase
MYNKIIKRVFDIIFSLLLIIVMLPFWMLICFILLLTGEHRIFFVQKRVGHKSIHFSIWKHATMLKDSEKMKGGLYTTRNDPRILPFGTFLRRTKLDEIPQLFHILSGKMSFVGPRPLVINNPYPKDLQDEIYKIKPGVTGIGSIVFRNEERLLSETDLSPEEFYANFILPYKASLELWYQKNVSVWTDTKLIFCTLYALIFPDTKLPYVLFRSLPSAPGNLNLTLA